MSSRNDEMAILTCFGFRDEMNKSRRVLNQRPQS